MNDILKFKVMDVAFSPVGENRKIIGIQVPVTVHITILKDEEGYHGCTMEMSDDVAKDLLGELQCRL